MSCNCNYTVPSSQPCISCVNVATASQTAEMTQKKIWRQVRAASSTYAMNLASINSGANRLISNSKVNWNQMSDRVLAGRQTVITPTRGNSVSRTLTSDRPGAASPGGSGVDVKHDSYARYLNRKKASNLKTQTQNIASKPLIGNKTKSIGLVANSISCCK
jgi:hypothetical protein